MNHPELSFEPNVTYVLGFAFDEIKDRVLMLLKTKPRWQEGLFNGVGGKIEADDWCYEAAMQREFLEETGVKTAVDQWSQFAEHVKSGPDSYRLLVFSTVLSQAQVEQVRAPTEETPYWKLVKYVADFLEPDIAVPGTAMYIMMALNHMDKQFMTRTIEIV